MLVHRRVTPSIQFASTHLYTWVERGNVKVKCFAQEQSTMSPARAWSRDERTNNEATAPDQLKISLLCLSHQETKGTIQIQQSEFV